MESVRRVTGQSPDALAFRVGRKERYLLPRVVVLHLIQSKALLIVTSIDPSEIKAIGVDDSDGEIGWR